MKIKIQFIISSILGAMIFLFSCTSSKVTTNELCSDFDSALECICPINFEKTQTQYGYLCLNLSCRDFVLNITCMPKCPDNFAPLEVRSNLGEFYYACYAIKNSLEMTCEHFPLFKNCTCPKGFERRTTNAGFLCKPYREKCEGFRLEDKCVEKCPEDYIPVIPFDVGGDPFCMSKAKINES